MTESVNHLFVYGTLLQKSNKFAVYLNENSCFYAKGRVNGKLYDIGEYPGLVLQPASDHFVYGSIYSMTDPKAMLKTLDDYEGFGADHLQPNEFVRELIFIETAGNLLECWVYLYNLPVNGLRHITSGDYLAYRT